MNILVQNETFKPLILIRYLKIAINTILLECDFNFF
jgi:hypothetical protein